VVIGGQAFQPITNPASLPGRYLNGSLIEMVRAVEKWMVALTVSAERATTGQANQ
jgi:hypothetical protein